MWNIRKFFSVLKSIKDFIFKDIFMGLNGFALIFYGIIVLGFIFQAFIELTITLIILLFFCGLPLAFIKEKGLKEYIICGEKKSFQEIFGIFSFKSYFVSLIFISSFLCIPILGIVSSIMIFGYTPDIILNNKLVIFYTMIFIESIIWFAYHIVNGQAEIQDIKIKVALFSAVAATILILVDVSGFLNDFKLIISYIAGSYFWVNFLIELRIKELEAETKTADKINHVLEWNYNIKVLEGKLKDFKDLNKKIQKLNVKSRTFFTDLIRLVEPGACVNTLEVPIQEAVISLNMKESKIKKYINILSQQEYGLAYINKEKDLEKIIIEASDWSLISDIKKYAELENIDLDVIFIKLQFNVLD